MTLVSRPVDHEMDQNYISVGHLETKLKRLRSHFRQGILPFPDAGVIAAWKDVPNDMVDTLSSSMNTESIVPLAPPPTPTTFNFDACDAAVNHSSVDGDLDVWRFVKGADSPTPKAPEYDTASEGSWYNFTGQIDVEEDSSRSPGSNSPSSSDRNSLSSSSNRSSPAPVEFHSMVNQWLLVYHTRGMNAFIESLIALATMSVASVPLASRIVRATVKRVGDTSYLEGKRLGNAIRSSSLEAFKDHWELSETNVSSADCTTASPAPHGINIASFMGSLFDAKISTAKDIEVCLSLLTKGEKRLDRLCAMHALVVQANDQLCKKRNLPALATFKREITARNEESDFLWATTPRSKMILADILATIERWLLSQAHKRQKNRVSSTNYAVRRRIVGPRFLFRSAVPHL